jgi:hypothetical protein
MRALFGVLGVALACIAGAASAISDDDAIEQALRTAPSVSFYFVSRTEDYDYDAQMIQAEASVVVRRSCGANCHNFMDPVLASLRASKKSKCLPGQQDLLVTFGRSQLIYSYSGKQARYQGRCYFNSQSIHQILENDGFFFR